MRVTRSWARHDRAGSGQTCINVPAVGAKNVRLWHLADFNAEAEDVYFLASSGLLEQPTYFGAEQQLL